MYILLAPATSAQLLPDGSLAWEALSLTDQGPGRRRQVGQQKLGDFVAAVERQNPGRTIRWAWADARQVMPLLLGQGVSPASCHDLRLAQQILARAATRAQSGLPYRQVLDLSTLRDPSELPVRPQAEGQLALFEGLSAAGAASGAVFSVDDLLAELQAQLAAVAASPFPERLSLLLAAESQGALIAAEIRQWGMPWDRAVHERILEQRLGPRPAGAERPAQMEAVAGRVRQLLAAPELNPDSPQELLRALQAAGVAVESTRKWDLVAWVEQVPQQSPERARRQALVEPILAYKRLARLFTANGWNWLDSWTKNNRFYPAYEVASAATGRWGGHGGGAMQLPQEVRSAVRAEPGMLLTVADAAQIEPRILAVMSGDRALAVAGRGRDLYLGIAHLGERTGSQVRSREQAKVALLAVMYGATTGEGGQLLPQMRRLFPQALGLTEQAALVGEQGGQVSTFLGRVSPVPSAGWFESQRRRDSAAAERAALSAARAQGRFTRNFVVQGTAAEWALVWMAQIRRALRTERLAGRPLSSRLVYFLHDEVVIYGPAYEAAQCARIVRRAASSAAQLIFGASEVEFPVSVAAVEDYSQAK